MDNHKHLDNENDLVNDKTTKTEEIKKKVNKTADRKAYMREYMRKRYLKDPKKHNKIRRSYYFKNKYSLTNEQMKKYGEHTTSIGKIFKEIDYIKKECPEFLVDVSRYMYNLLEKD